MTIEKTLEKLHQLAQLLPDQDRAIYETVRKHPGERFTLDTIGSFLADWIANMEREAARDAAKKTGNAQRLRAMERIVKAATKDKRPALHGAWNADGLQYVCDSFRLVGLRDPLNLPTIPEDVEPIDAARILKPATENDGARLALPDPAELRAYIKNAKAKSGRNAPPPFYDFGDGLPRVNAQYLLDLLEIFPGAAAICSKQSPMNRAIYFDSTDGCGLLLPVRKP